MDFFVFFESFVKDNICVKWFLEGNNCVKLKQSDIGGVVVMVNGVVNLIYFKRFFLDFSSKLFVDLDINQLFFMESFLKK